MWDWMSTTTADSETLDRVRQSPILNFEHTTRHNKLLRSEAEYQGVKFTINGFQPQKVWIRFSPHKLYNSIFGFVNKRGEPMNHDTFTPAKLEYVLDWLADTFAIDPCTCTTHHIEFGVNLRGLVIPTRTIIENLIAYGLQGKQFNIMEVVNAGMGRKLLFSQYLLKLYDKALQNGIEYEIFRFEYKALKMQNVEYIFGRNTRLIDFLEPTFWIRCKDKLLSVLDCCIFDDDYDVDHKNLPIWRNSRECGAMSSSNRSRQKKAFDQFIEQHGKLHIKQTLTEAIENEVRAMLDGYV